MDGVECYLNYLKTCGYLSETFLNTLRQYHKKIANEVATYKPYLTDNGDFAIPGLNIDIIFGFEPGEILDHIVKGKFSHTYIVYHKAICRFKINTYNNMIFILTKENGKWLIDDISYDVTYLDRPNNYSGK